MQHGNTVYHVAMIYYSILACNATHYDLVHNAIASIWSRIAEALDPGSRRRGLRLGEPRALQHPGDPEVPYLEAAAAAAEEDVGAPAGNEHF